jgi:hypothetical protein
MYFEALHIGAALSAVQWCQIDIYGCLQHSITQMHGLEFPLVALLVISSKVGITNCFGTLSTFHITGNETSLQQLMAQQEKPH